ncbi:carboxylesterase/lipase family protein [Pseudonocardia sp. GCM10023141]|uniref:carboxylesterase/lipase family protein n=1 Tax=Pseudonocardia sp. GCM10023141 TaxID=3252653 RepID=UPI00360E6723
MISRRSFVGGLAATAAGLPFLTACGATPPAATGTAAGAAVVTTRNGTLRGGASGGVLAFRGVQYAAPPIGHARFQLPAPVKPWTGVRDALDWGAAPYQPIVAPPEDAMLFAFPGPDSLNLNVWTPDPGSTRLPVMVRIPGGDGETGTSGSFDGATFARDGVVFVSINYRLGVDGFLFADGVEANIGLLDQVAALQWVHDNIAAFGGDPGNVTVVGESVAALMAMRRAEGLYHRMIMESGSAQQALTADAARQVTSAFAAVLDVEPTPAAIAAAPLGSVVDAQTVLRAALGARPDPQAWGGGAGAPVRPWLPVVDEDVLAALPLTRVASGSAAGVPVLVGSNAEESRLWLVPDGTIDRATSDLVARAASGYGLTGAAYAAFGAAHPGARPGDLLAALQTDWYHRMPALAVAEARTATAAPTYLYEFAWRSPQYGAQLGSCHAVEVAFVMDRLEDQRRFFSLVGSASTAPQQLATAMHKAWVDFATTGDPGWPRYDTARRATMRFDTVSAVLDDPHAAERAIWRGLR